MSQISPPRPRRQVNLRSVALPAEHGGWGFVLEPIVLGLIVAWSAPGVALAAAALAFFLLHQPLRLAVRDHLKQRRVDRTIYAERFALAYAAAGSVGLLLAALAAPPSILIPLGLALPLVAVQFVHDIRSQSRSTAAEVSGAGALGAVAAAVAVAGGWPLVEGLVLWLLMAVRAVTSIIYVRARLRLEYGAPANASLSRLAHGAGAVVLAGCVAAGFAPWLALAAYSLLVARAALGLSARRQPAPAKTIGMREMVYGLVYAVVIGAAYAL